MGDIHYAGVQRKLVDALAGDQTAPIEQPERFVRDWHLGLYTMTELGARYDISRKTGTSGSSGSTKVGDRRSVTGVGRLITVPTESRTR